MQLFISMLTLCLATNPVEYQNHTLLGFAQGTSYRIHYFSGEGSPESAVNQKGIDSLLRIIDDSMSSYNPGSLLRKFNEEGNTEIRMDAHLQKVIAKSFEIHHLSGGIFDITVEPLVSLWGFGANPLEDHPTDDQILQVLSYVGMDKLCTDGNILKKLHPRTKIDVNGIAQGYTVDLIADYLESRGVRHYLVELGGEIRAKGGKPGGQPFHVGIERSGYPDDPLSHYLFPLHTGALTTSGKIPYGATKPHHIDPRTGYPFVGNNWSVTVFATDATTADALDNVLIAMQKTELINYIHQLEEIEVLLTYQDEHGQFIEWMSPGFRHLLSNQN